MGNCVFVYYEQFLLKQHATVTTCDSLNGTQAFKPTFGQALKQPAMLSKVNMGCDFG